MEQYKIIKVIGDGTYGTVSKAVTIKTNDIVAIKTMKKKFISWDECMQLREIKSLKKLTHPNIIRLKEVIRVGDILNMVFEFADINLFQMIKSRPNPFTEIEIQNIMHQTLLGVAFIHKNGFFHRDLKPENLMINKTSSGLVIKICDFGQAREIRSTPPYTEYIATRWYRAPECLLRSNVYSSPVDMFALGCIMAELYLNRPLFPGSSENDQLFKICSVLGTPTSSTWPEGLKLGIKIGYQFPSFVETPLASLIPNASNEAIDLMTAMLKFDPQKRITSAHALSHPYFASISSKDISGFDYNKPIKHSLGYDALIDQVDDLLKFDEPKSTNDYSAEKPVFEENFDFAPDNTKFHFDNDPANDLISKNRADSNPLVTPNKSGIDRKSDNSSNSKKADLDYIAEIINDRPIYSFETKKDSPECGTEESKSRRKNQKFLLRPGVKAEDDSNSWNKKLTEDKNPNLGINSVPLNPRRLTDKRSIIDRQEPINPLQESIGEYKPSAFSGESNYMFHKRMEVNASKGGSNLSPGMIGSGLRASYMNDGAYPETTKSIHDAQLKGPDNGALFSIYDQGPTETEGMINNSIGGQGPIQFSYGRYKHNNN